jgi:pimeloyl-ACP methyl ester carboxylesterase
VSWDYRMASLPGAARVFRRTLSTAAIERYGRRLVFNGERLPVGWAERRMRIWGTPNAVDAFFRTARQVLSLRGQRYSYGGRLHEIRQRTLVMWGREDPIIPVAHGHLAAARIPNATLHVFARCGHVPPWEYPEEFAERVVDFLGEP